MENVKTWAVGYIVMVYAWVGEFMDKYNPDAIGGAFDDVNVYALGVYAAMAGGFHAVVKAIKAVPRG